MASGFLVFNLRGFLNTSLLSVECGLSLKRVRPFRICFAATPPVPHEGRQGRTRGDRSTHEGVGRQRETIVEHLGTLVSETGCNYGQLWLYGHGSEEMSALTPVTLASSPLKLSRHRKRSYESRMNRITTKTQKCSQL